MTTAYSLIGLIFCMRLALQRDAPPILLSAAYGVGFIVVWPLLGVSWCGAALASLVAFPLCFGYLIQVKAAQGWRFLVLLPAALAVAGIPQWVATAVCRFLTLEF
jgi:hypothetical protein